MDKDKVLEFLGYAVTCRKQNTLEWMKGFEEKMNDLLVFMGDGDRVKYLNASRLEGGFQIIKPNDKNNPK